MPECQRVFRLFVDFITKSRPSTCADDGGCKIRSGVLGEVKPSGAEYEYDDRMQFLRRNKFASRLRVNAAQRAGKLTNKIYTPASDADIAIAGSTSWLYIFRLQAPYWICQREVLNCTNTLYYDLHYRITSSYLVSNCHWDGNYPIWQFE